MKEEEKQERAPAAAPTPKGPKVWKYVGPTTNIPLISNLPGTGQAWRANDLPQQYIQFVLDTVPQAKYWWE